MKKSELENIELNLLLEAIYMRYGYDFRHYAMASIERRAKQIVQKNRLKSISECIPIILNDESFFESTVKEFSITVTELFRDPFVYRKLTETVFPVLKTYPFIRIWHAGCATGEEVYSLAILLKENNMYDNARIYATDFNDVALETAKRGIYKIENVKQCIINYQNSGGSNSFSEYYNAKYDSISISNSLKKNITFANHNLVTDSVFGEMNLVLCRNVLIYFDKELQNRVLELISDSLVNGGFLCLGTMESLSFTSVDKEFELFSEKEKIYQKKYSLPDEHIKKQVKAKTNGAIVIGVSAGGLKVLHNLFSLLRTDLQTPIIVTQHLSPNDESSLAEVLNFKSRVKVVEAKHSMKIKQNQIYVGPPDYHLIIDRHKTFILSEDDKVNYSRPSIEILFKSASRVYGRNLTGILLTGANEDGSEGLAAIKSNGGLTIVQDPESAEYKVMPLSAIEMGVADKVLKINEIADFINSL